MTRCLHIALLGLGMASHLSASPNSLPGIVKTLEGVLAKSQLASPGPGQGLQPLESAAHAAGALLQSLDPHGSSGASLDPWPESNEAGRTGIQVTKKDGFAVIAGTLPGSPASETSLREGDRILAIGDTTLAANPDLMEIRSLLQGKAGDKVTLKVLRDNLRDTLTETIERAEWKPSIEVRKLLGGVGYAQVLGPTALGLAEYKLRVTKLGSEEDLIGLVLDFRNLSGGGPEEATALVSPFLSKKEVAKVHEVGKDPMAYTTGEDPAVRVPLVVLVSPATSGAGEMAAMALQKNRRAVLLGGETAGEASKYRSHQVAGVHLRYPEYLVSGPKGNLLTGRGLDPDIAVAAEAVPRNQAKFFAGQSLAFAKGETWEPPKEKSETDKNIESALEAEDGDEEAQGDEAQEEAEEPQEDEGSDEAEEPKAEEEEGPRDPFHDYPLVKRYDPRLVRGVHLLMANHIFRASQP